MFTPTWGNDPIWQIFFRWGWNHQLDNRMSWRFWTFTIGGSTIFPLISTAYWYFQLVCNCHSWIPYQKTGIIQLPFFLGGHKTFKTMANCCYNSNFFWNFYLTIVIVWVDVLYTLQEINISHLGKRKIIFKMDFSGDMLVYRSVMNPWTKKRWTKKTPFFWNRSKPKTHASSAKAYSTFTQLHQYQW